MISCIMYLRVSWAKTVPIEKWDVELLHMPFIATTIIKYPTAFLLSLKTNIQILKDNGWCSQRVGKNTKRNVWVPKFFFLGGGYHYFFVILHIYIMIKWNSQLKRSSKWNKIWNRRTFKTWCFRRIHVNLYCTGIGRLWQAWLLLTQYSVSQSV